LLFAVVLIAHAIWADLLAATVINEHRTVVVISLDGFPADALNDPRLPIPTLRRLIREGAAATSMRPQNPTVTWPNHTSIVTGVTPAEHRVLYNGAFQRSDRGRRPSVDPTRDKDRMVHAETIYDAAFKAGLTTAQVDWVAINRAKTITWQFPELPDPDGAIERELIAAGIITTEQLRTFEDSSQAWQDEIWTAATEDILEKHRPDLLLLHLLTLDDTSHQYGPMTNASAVAMAFLDAKVKQIVDVLDRAGLASNAALIIVSDHGFRSYQHTIQANVFLRQKGLQTGEGEHAKGDVWVMPEGGIAMVYVSDPARRPELLPQLRAMFTAAEGVEGVYGVDEFEKLGLPTSAEGDQAPDLLLVAKPDYMFGSESEGLPITHDMHGGTHGYLNRDPKMQAIFIAWGAGVPKGVRLGEISNLDVAPTIAALLGIKMQKSRGHVIEQITESRASH